MFSSEIKKFYKNDQKKYLVDYNLHFLEWYKTKINNGYQLKLSLKDIQTLIWKLVSWYEIKYPDRLFEKQLGCVDNRFPLINDISDYLTFEQLKYRLDSKEIEALTCNYRSKSKYQSPIDGFISEQGFSYGITEWKNYNCFYLYDPSTQNTINVLVDDNGIIRKEDLSELKPYIGNYEADMSINMLLDRLKKSNLEYGELKQGEYNHFCDIELRNHILNMTISGLLYSANSNPVYSKKRAFLFIEECKDYFNGEVNLNENTIKEAYNIGSKELSNDLSIYDRLRLMEELEIDYSKISKMSREEIMEKLEEKLGLNIESDSLKDMYLTIFCNLPSATKKTKSKIKILTNKLIPFKK